ncbi:MAG: hypothetical protein VW268_11045 [Rhodospirillaceae bacterium]
MSRLERFLLFGIIFLIGVKVMMAQQEKFNATPPPAAAYDWDPSGFSKDGIPKKLALEARGRIPDRFGLSDTQRAFVYAYIVEYHYARLLARAKASCGANAQGEITNWETRNAQTLADAKAVLAAINHNPPKSAADMPDGMKRLLCAEIAKRIVSGGYEPHPDAIARLAQAAGRAR